MNEGRTLSNNPSISITKRMKLGELQLLNLISGFCDLNLVKPGDFYTDFGIAIVSLRNFEFVLDFFVISNPGQNLYII